MGLEARQANTALILSPPGLRRGAPSRQGLPEARLQLALLVPGVGLAADVQPAPPPDDEAVLTAPPQHRFRLQPRDQRRQRPGRRRDGQQGRGRARPAPRGQRPAQRRGQRRRPPPRGQGREGRAAQRAERPSSSPGQEGQHAPCPAGTAHSEDAPPLSPLPRTTNGPAHPPASASAPAPPLPRASRRRRCACANAASRRGAGQGPPQRLRALALGVTCLVQDGGARRDLPLVAAVEPLDGAQPRDGGGCCRRSALRGAGLRHRRAGDAHGAGECAGPRQQEGGLRSVLPLRCPGRASVSGARAPPCWRLRGNAPGAASGARRTWYALRRSTRRRLSRAALDGRMVGSGVVSCHRALWSGPDPDTVDGQRGACAGVPFGPPFGPLCHVRAA